MRTVGLTFKKKNGGKAGKPNTKPAKTEDKKEDVDADKQQEQGMKNPQQDKPEITPSEDE